MTLLTPGPCMTSESVRAAAALPDINHRDPDYERVHADVRAALRRLGAGAVPYVLGGSGTVAMEATIASCVQHGPCLIVSNGYYAERYERIFAAHQIPYEALPFPWSSPWKMELIEQRLATRRFEAVLATHHETSTGRLNPVGDLAAVAARHGTRVFVDAVSSLGAEPLSFEGVHAAFASANKCLHGLPGVSFVLLDPTFAPMIEGFPRRSYTLHLPLYGGERPPMTPPVPAVRAFRQALAEFEVAGGVPARHGRYARQAARVRSFLRSVGCGTFVSDEEASCAVTVATMPRGYVADAWLQANFDAGFVLFECKGDLRETHFQVSTMGEVTDAMVEDWVSTASRLIESRP